MKTTRLAFLSFVAIIAMGLSLSSCKKDNKSTTTATKLTQSGLMQQSAGDDQDDQDARDAEQAERQSGAEPDPDLVLEGVL